MHPGRRGPDMLQVSGVSEYSALSARSNFWLTTDSTPVLVVYTWKSSS